jgi:hypothetical protein
MALLVCGVFLVGAVVGLVACGTQAAGTRTSRELEATSMSRSSTSGSVSSDATSDAPSDGPETTIPPPVNGPQPGTYLRDEIPLPILDGTVEGYSYKGNGRFLTESGREFVWRDGHFFNGDGSLMEIPASLREYMHEHGVDAQPTAVVTHYDAPTLEVTPRNGVSVTVRASQWTVDRVTATVVIHNSSGSSFSFANKDLQLFVNDNSVEQTYPDMKPFEVAPGTSESRTDVYFIVSHFDPPHSKFVYAPSATR